VVTAALARSRLDVWLRILAAILGTLPVALLGSACLARFLPLSEDARFAIGLTAAIPLWITGMCFAYLARSGARAWLVCLLTCAAMAVVVYGIRG